MKKVSGLILLSYILLLCSQCNRIEITPVADVPDSSVFAMAVYNNELYVGGCFDSVGNIKSKYIAKWDGKKWASVGKGLNQGYRGVEAMVIYNGELYVAGDFRLINDTTEVEHIAKWNGKDWQSVGNGKPDGTHPYISTLCVYKNQLYAASLFDSIGGIKAKNIARWNGERWDNVGQGVNYTIIALIVFNDELYAGGICTNESGNLVKWNGSIWTPMGKGITTNCEVQSFAVFHNKLVLAGTFSTVDNLYTNNIAFWNGKTFEKFPIDVQEKDASMATMLVFNDNLFVGGRQNRNVITKWGDKSGQIIATDTSGYVSCFAKYNGDIFAGGSFRYLNGQPIKYLMRMINH